MHGWYTDCILSPEEELFFGFDSKDDSDCGAGDATSATFDFTATPMMSQFQESESGKKFG